MNKRPGLGWEPPTWAECPPSSFPLPSSSGQRCYLGSTSPTFRPCPALKDHAHCQSHAHLPRPPHPQAVTPAPALPHSGVSTVQADPEPVLLMDLRLRLTSAQPRGWDRRDWGERSRSQTYPLPHAAVTWAVPRAWGLSIWLHTQGPGLHCWGEN